MKRRKFTAVIIKEHEQSPINRSFNGACREGSLTGGGRRSFCSPRPSALKNEAATPFRILGSIENGRSAVLLLLLLLLLRRHRFSLSECRLMAHWWANEFKGVGFWLVTWHQRGMGQRGCDPVSQSWEDLSCARSTSQLLSLSNGI